MIPRIRRRWTTFSFLAVFFLSRRASVVADVATTSYVVVAVFRSSVAVAAVRAAAAIAAAAAAAAAVSLALGTQNMGNSGCGN